MPIKWDAQNDRILLLKIIEVCKVSPDVNQIAARWPADDNGNRPTPRAITERLAKIRNTVRAGGGDFAISGKGKIAAKATVGKDTGDAAKPRKPRAPKALKKEEPITPPPSSPIMQLKSDGSGEQGRLALEGQDPQSPTSCSDNPAEPVTPISGSRKRSFGESNFKIETTDYDQTSFADLDLFGAAQEPPAKRNKLSISGSNASFYGNDSASFSINNSYGATGFDEA